MKVTKRTIKKNRQKKLGRRTTASLNSLLELSRHVTPSNTRNMLDTVKSFEMTVQFAITKKVPVSVKELETGIKEMRRARVYFNKMLAFTKAQKVDTKTINAINNSIIEVNNIITQARKVIKKKVK
ncbi:hypothetical protein KKG83_01370 [Candidatus Micrarchaeota archaeon]|nr:hypothetical protein [Candidatus Micrarchaeota archaeon]